MLTFSVKNATNNSTKLTALNLAYGQVEWVKSLKYDDIGIDEKEHPVEGIVKNNLYMNEDGSDPKVIEGIEYRIRTSIYWDADKSITKEPVPKARKKIDVYVEALNPITRKTNEYSVLETLITFEGERDPIIPGYMNIYAYYQSSTSQALQNVKIETKTELGASEMFVYTDREGKAIVVDLSEGNYLIKPTNYSKIPDFMTMPTKVTADKKNWDIEKKVEVPKWNKSNPPTYPNHTFLLDYPAKIKFKDISKYPVDLVIPLYPSLTRGTYSLEDGKVIADVTLKPRIDEIEKIKFWRLWTYDWGEKDSVSGEIFIDYNGERFYLSEYINDEIKEWDGVFDTTKKETVVDELLLTYGLKSEGKILKIDGKLAIEVEFTSRLKSLEEFEIELESDTVTIAIPKRIDDNNQVYSISYNPEKNKMMINFKTGFKLEDFIDINKSWNLKLTGNRAIEAENNFGMRLAPYKNESKLIRVN